MRLFLFFWLLAPLALRGESGTRENQELSYQRKVQRTTLAEAARLYDAVERGEGKIAYAAFTPESAEVPGKDLGYGFHVVKRWESPMADGSLKVVEVNESWPENKQNGGLLLPDELRIKVTVGGEILFDSVRLTWGPSRELEVLRQSRWRGNAPKQLRVPVSAPISCLKCHGPGKETRVQPEFYLQPVTQMEGYRKYLQHLQGTRDRSFVKRVEKTLRDPLAAFRVEGLAEKLNYVVEHTSYSWVMEDDKLSNVPYWPNQPEYQGVYRRSDGDYYLDFTETVFEGKYRWWEPFTAIPDDWK